MKVILKEDTHYILRGERGEDLKKNLLNFCKENQITAGWFTGLGACDHAILSYYDLKTQKYVDRTFTGQHEITNLTGNVSLNEGETMIHAHVTLGNTNFEAVAGHVQELVISGTFEVHLVVFEEKMTRNKDEETGLTILD